MDRHARKKRARLSKGVPKGGREYMVGNPLGPSPASGARVMVLGQQLQLVADEGRAWGDTRLSLRSAAKPLSTRFPIIFSTCFPKVTIGFIPSRTLLREAALALAARGAGPELVLDLERHLLLLAQRLVAWG